MHLLGYPQLWTEMVTEQIAASHGTRRVRTWGYGCVVIGDNLEKFLANQANWQNVNRLSGEHLHIFCLVPPPPEFISKRITEVENMPDSSHKTNALELLWKAKDKLPSEEKMASEKARLLLELRDAGGYANESADFLFFDFRNTGNDTDEVTIDVIAVKSALLGNNLGVDAYSKIFRKLGETASKAHDKNYSAKKFTEMVDNAWAWRRLVSVAPNLWNFVKACIGVSGKSK